MPVRKTVDGALQHDRAQGAADDDEESGRLEREDT
jgi:hypothetical protein